MSALSGRVAVVTGAGNGIGRQHALLLAAEGAKVVVNDVGWNPDGSGADDRRPADSVVSEIVAAGGTAIASYDDVSEWSGGALLVERAIEHFGALHVLVNNAGIIRNADLVDMTDEQWDQVVGVNLRGAVSTTRRAARYWRDEAAAGRPVRASLIVTGSSTALSLEGGPIGAAGLPSDPATRSAHRMSQSNYIVAKAGAVAFGLLCSVELAPYGVRSNVLCPRAMTRMATVYSDGGPGSYVAPPPDDPSHPANNAPLVAYLAAAECPITGRVFLVLGREIISFDRWSPGARIRADGPWTIAQIARELPDALRRSDPGPPA